MKFFPCTLCFFCERPAKGWNSHACGDGFLLAEVYPWEYGVPTRYDLLHLNKDGTMNLIAPDIRHMSGEVILLASPGENQTRVIHLDDAGNYRQHLYSGN